MRSQLLIIASAVIAFILFSFKILNVYKEINPIRNFQNEVKYLLNYPDKIANFSELFEKIFNTKISIAYCDGKNYYNYSAKILACNEVFIANLTNCNRIVVTTVYIPFLNYRKPTICYCIKYKNLIDLKCL